MHLIKAMDLFLPCQNLGVLLGRVSCNNKGLMYHISTLNLDTNEW